MKWESGPQGRLGMEKRRIKLIVEYDGTDFAGFQAQGKGERTVQSVLQSAVEQISTEPVIIRPAGRTDSGVHARGQVIDFDLASRIPTNRIAGALNGLLPRDLAVRGAQDVDATFSARFSATQRTYVYVIRQETHRSALWGRYSLWVPDALDTDAMKQAASLLVGTRDFAAFANAGGDPGSTTRRDLRRFEVRRVGNGPMILVILTANAFLRSMVRNLVGGLLAVGRADSTPSAMLEVVETRDRTQNPYATVPAHGLCFLRVDY